jgi:U6 snRNA-associated Sm-like protein LSm7
MSNISKDPIIKLGAYMNQEMK